MTATPDLYRALAAYLADAEPSFAYRPTGAYAPDEVAIVLVAAGQRPDRVIALGLYALDDDPHFADSTFGLQVRIRAPGDDPTEVDRIGDLAFDALHGNRQLLSVPTVTVLGCARTSSTPLGRDAQARWERSDNYQLTCHRPAPHRY